MAAFRIWRIVCFLFGRWKTLKLNVHTLYTTVTMVMRISVYSVKIRQIINKATLFPNLHIFSVIQMEDESKKLGICHGCGIGGCLVLAYTCQQRCWGFQTSELINMRMVASSSGLGCDCALNVDQSNNLPRIITSSVYASQSANIMYNRINFRKINIHTLKTRDWGDHIRQVREIEWGVWKLCARCTVQSLISVTGMGSAAQNWLPIHNYNTILYYGMYCRTICDARSAIRDTTLLLFCLFILNLWLMCPVILYYMHITVHVAMFFYFYWTFYYIFRISSYAFLSIQKGHNSILLAYKSHPLAIKQMFYMIINSSNLFFFMIYNGPMNFVAISVGSHTISSFLSNCSRLLSFLFKGTDIDIYCLSLPFGLSLW